MVRLVALRLVIAGFTSCTVLRLAASAIPPNLTTSPDSMRHGAVAHLAGLHEAGVNRRPGPYRRLQFRWLFTRLPMPTQRIFRQALMQRFQFRTLRYSVFFAHGILPVP